MLKKYIDDYEKMTSRPWNFWGGGTTNNKA